MQKLKHCTSKGSRGQSGIIVFEEQRLRRRWQNVLDHRFGTHPKFDLLPNSTQVGPRPFLPGRSDIDMHGWCGNLINNFPVTERHAVYDQLTGIVIQQETEGQTLIVEAWSRLGTRSPTIKLKYCSHV